MKLTKSELREIIKEDLRKWFGSGKTGSVDGGGWDRYNLKGKKIGKCGDAEEGEPYAACLSKEKADKLGPKGRASFVRRKREAQKKAGDAKKGKNTTKGKSPTLVKTKANENTVIKDFKVVCDKCNWKWDFSDGGSKPYLCHKCGNDNTVKYKKMNVEEKLTLFLEKNVPTDSSKWSYAKSQAKEKFDVYPSAYANAWAAKKYKELGGGWKKEESLVKEDNPCWDGYQQIGMKMKDGKEVPNCVPVSELNLGYIKTIVGEELLKMGIVSESMLMYPHQIEPKKIEAFLKKYPQVENSMKPFLSTRLMQGYRKWLNWKGKNEDKLGGTPNTIDSPSFGSKTFYKHDWSIAGIDSWAAVFQYLTGKQFNDPSLYSSKK